MDNNINLSNLVTIEIKEWKVKVSMETKKHIE